MKEGVQVCGVIFCAVCVNSEKCLSMIVCLSTESCSHFSHRKKYQEREDDGFFTM